MAETKHTMLVITSFAHVPIPEVSALWERLQAAGWIWQENGDDWNVVFRKEFADSESADGATDEMRDLMKDFECPPFPEAFEKSRTER
jgi:hypothetical protein